MIIKGRVLHVARRPARGKGKFMKLPSVYAALQDASHATLTIQTKVAKTFPLLSMVSDLVHSWIYLDAKDDNNAD